MDGARPVAVVVVAYGDPAHLDACLTELSAPGDAVVLVVDNGLSDEARSVALAHGAEYVRPDRNLGFSGRCEHRTAAAGRLGAC